jgi:hypothetical protein
VLIRKVVLVPRETMASEGRSGRARIVEGLSPVKAMTPVSLLKPKRLTKYSLMLPKILPPSSWTWPSFCFRSAAPSLPPAVRASKSSCQSPLLMSHRFMPVTSLMSMGATLPRNTEAKNEDTREMRETSAKCSGYLVLKRMI